MSGVRPGGGRAEQQHRGDRGDGQRDRDGGEPTAASGTADRRPARAIAGARRASTCSPVATDQQAKNAWCRVIASTRWPSVRTRVCRLASGPSAIRARPDPSRPRVDSTTAGPSRRSSIGGGPDARYTRLPK
jgi:hypothetical protein